VGLDEKPGDGSPTLWCTILQRCQGLKTLTLNFNTWFGETGLFITSIINSAYTIACIDQCAATSLLTVKAKVVALGSFTVCSATRAVQNPVWTKFPLPICGSLNLMGTVGADILHVQKQFSKNGLTFQKSSRGVEERDRKVSDDEEIVSVVELVWEKGNHTESPPGAVIVQKRGSRTQERQEWARPCETR
jgi:hypothetical protein